MTAYPLTVPATFGDLVEEPRSFFHGTFEVSDPADTFVELPGWGKGYVWVNGFCLGRHRERGPQERLHLPAPLLRAGVNELVVLELDRAGSTVRLTPE
ncbi:hypothetical protein [Nonomuraea guangzhouensis]|uniref:Beta-galactosidase galactose-binding domain-containing protein n=1 Tax=Nonomuraea guangzhouensis TaxID=1291555 RepID=A0ABW4GW03_9ACTN|nr:hypothetical protein [Nonomuraea guangzhouensis]